MFQNAEGKEEGKTSILEKNKKKSHSKIYANIWNINIFIVTNLTTLSPLEPTL